MHLLFHSLLQVSMTSFFSALTGLEKEFALVGTSDSSGKCWDTCVSDLSALTWNLANGNEVPDQWMEHCEIRKELLSGKMENEMDFISFINVVVVSLIQNFHVMDEPA